MRVNRFTVGFVSITAPRYQFFASSFSSLISAVKPLIS